MIESVIGLWNTILIYMLSGFFLNSKKIGMGGAYMSSGLSDVNSYSAGASGAIFGLIGAMIGIVVVNWKLLDSAKSLKYMLLCMVVMICLLNLIFSMGIANSFQPGKKGDNVDNWAHLGGFLSGMSLSM